MRYAIAFVLALSLAAPAHAAMLEWPIEVVQPWTQIQSPFGPRVQNDAPDFHRGVDFTGERGDRIVAAADGEVFRAYAEDDQESPYTNGGNTVIVKHDAPAGLRFKRQDITRYYTLYQHLDSISVAQGDTVSAGEQVGTMGDSGTAQRVHLHFEVRLQTTCSIFSECNATGFDPAVHPLRYLEYEQTGRVRARLRRYRKQLRVRVRTPRDRLDVNRVRVITRNRQGRVLKRRTVNFSTRSGLDMTTQDTMDAMNTRRVRIRAKSIGSTGSDHTIHFRFKKLLNKKTRRVTVRVEGAQRELLRKHTKKTRRIRRT